MCLRFVLLLLTLMTSWLRLSRREEAWKTAEISIPRWHRDIVRRRWAAARSKRGRTGTPAARRNIKALALQLARENPLGATGESTASWPIWE